jgi:hypothetical protein
VEKAVGRETVRGVIEDVRSIFAVGDSVVMKKGERREMVGLLRRRI